jgi:hypothetical protein
MCFPEGRSQKTAASGLNGKEEEEEKTGTQRRCRHRSFDEAPFLFFSFELLFPIYPPQPDGNNFYKI